MRALFLVLASATVFAAGTTQLAARDYRFCIQGEEFGNGPTDCNFVTYQQCQATASGRMAHCEPNLAFSNVVPILRTHSRHH